MELAESAVDWVSEFASIVASWVDLNGNPIQFVYGSIELVQVSLLSASLLKRCRVVFAGLSLEAFGCQPEVQWFTENWNVEGG